MRRLLLLRHSKAERAEPRQSDHERPLAERGQRDAPKIGAYLAKHALLPDRTLVSTSTRTRQTWDLACAAMGKKRPAVQFEERIYEATPQTLLKVIKENGARAKTLLMVGHNPGMHELATMLIATGDIDARQQLREAFPTSALAVIEFALNDWERLHPGAGRLEHFITPRSLDEPD